MKERNLKVWNKNLLLRVDDRSPEYDFEYFGIIKVALNNLENVRRYRLNIKVRRGYSH